jgi:2-polyprenyl-3-methyl-5-hydroxy-6-metoxy-1,4-benzoquinol methylase
MESWKARVYASYGGATAGRVFGSADDDAEFARAGRLAVQRYRDFLPPDKTAPILDVGCGSGSFLDALRSLGYSTLEGVDLSPAQVDAGRARGLTGITLTPAVDYLRGRSARYALITAFNVLEHQTRAELFELLDAVHAALSPGGRLIALVPNAKGLFGAHVRFNDITHELSFTPQSVAQICAVTGFQCEAVLEHGPVVHGVVSAVRWTMWQAIRGLLLLARMAEGGDWRRPIFTQDLVFVARKPAA